MTLPEIRSYYNWFATTYREPVLPFPHPVKSQAVTASISPIINYNLENAVTHHLQNIEKGYK